LRKPLSRPSSRPRWSLPAGLLATAFGAATVLSGGRVLFGPDSARTAAGQVVPFVLWFNFLAGFAYLVAGLGLARARPWAPPLSLAIAAATALVFLALGVHILRGGGFEPRTVAAMTLRTAVWSTIAAVAWRRKPRPSPPP
jgi:hypothetical protein